MNICKDSVVTKSTKLISGHLYQNDRNNALYIYCYGKDIFINLERGSFCPAEKGFVFELTDVTDQYCLQKL